MVQCWQSNAKAKLRQGRSVTNSKTNVKEHVPVQNIVLTQSYDANILPSASYLDAGRRIKDSGRSVDIYIYRDRNPSQHVTVGLAWGSPRKKNGNAGVSDSERTQLKRVQSTKGQGPVSWQVPAQSTYSVRVNCMHYPMYEDRAVEESWGVRKNTMAPQQNNIRR